MSSFICSLSDTHGVEANKGMVKLEACVMQVVPSQAQINVEDSGAGTGGFRPLWPENLVGVHEG